MTITTVPPISPAAPARGGSRGSGGFRKLVWRSAVVLLVLALLGGIGAFVYRVHATVLEAGMWGYAGNTPSVTLNYGGGSRLVVDDTAGALHPIMFSVLNPGPATVTLRSVEDFAPIDVAGFRVSPLGPNGMAPGFADAPRTQLSGVKIRPGQQVALWMSVKGQGCVSGAAGSSTTISSVPIAMTIMGIQRVEWVTMPTLVTVMSNPSVRSEARYCLRTAG